MKSFMFLYVMLFALGGVFAEICGDVVDNKWKFYSVISAIVLDAILGIIKHLRNKTFVPSKSLIFVGRIVFCCWLIHLTIGFSKGYDYLDWMSTAVIFPIIGGYLWSIAGNATELNLINGKAKEWIQSNIKKKQDSIIDFVSEPEIVE